MTYMTQHMVRILQCNKQEFKLTPARVDELEFVVLDELANKGIGVQKLYNEAAEKHIYIVIDGMAEYVYQNKKRIDALAKLIIRMPCLHEPIRVRYNAMIRERMAFKKTETAVEKRQRRLEARYNRKMALIAKLNEQRQA